MTDQEIKEQIERDTRKWCKAMLQSEEDFDSFSHEQGRELQDKIATNRTVDAAIEVVESLVNSTIDTTAVVKELEKLRR